MNGTPPKRRSALLGSLVLAAGTGCRDAPPPAERAAPKAAPPAPWSARPLEPTPPRGMLWIPEGALIAGTPPGRIPRIAEAEMPGEQLVLHGFFIDQFPYPNEEGAIPETGASWARAERACEERGKRLCTELEWERACKGPRNLSYEYGDRYRPEVCVTGHAPRMLPSGLRSGCRSDFGVRDLHGGVWEWTASRWGRGNPAELYTLRGGNSVDGELVGRCANAMARPAKTTSSEIGFRCCKGEPNQVQVRLPAFGAGSFEQRGKLDVAARSQLEELAPAEVRETIASAGALQLSALWDWEPIGKLPLVVASGCVGAAPSHRCAVWVAELSPGPPQLIGWSWVGNYPPALRMSKWDSRKLWMNGADRRSSFRQELFYESGRVRAGELTRKLPKDPKLDESGH
jgi:formylglycine-generating enzyme